jgi:hypothetical protein
MGHLAGDRDSSGQTKTQGQLEQEGSGMEKSDATASAIMRDVDEEGRVEGHKLAASVMFLQPDTNPGLNPRSSSLTPQASLRPRPFSAVIEAHS